MDHRDQPRDSAAPRTHRPLSPRTVVDLTYALMLLEAARRQSRAR